ncbi:MAG: sulfate ABC transporter ATP-binding protein [Candidatus Omnitrophica bacterium]|nr:sulfate ABC transporter ATP-binding protein [Candidatus Omnitrophota bacterium]
MSIEVKHIVKTFDAFKALDDVSLKVQTGELIALLGPSGSGKTTLLRIIAGLETADAGEILFQGNDAKDKKIKDRNVGFVFQHYALFRHMTVAENISFGLKVQPKHIRLSEDKIKAKVKELLHLVQLDWVGNRYPSQLSGGQRQRIALARALAIEPKVLLLDEPFGSLDAQVRKELRQWLRRFHDDLHITSLFVTHDQEEALEVADRVVVMNQGHIEQIGTPQEVYHKPASVFVLNFLGNVNLFRGRVIDGKLFLDHSGANLSQGGDLSNIKPANLYIRPHQLDISRHPQGDNAIKSIVKFLNLAGSSVKLDLSTEFGNELQVEITQQEYSQLKLIKGENVFVCPKDVTFCEYEI